MNGPVLMWAAIPWAIVTLLLVWQVRRLEDRCRELDDSIRTEALHRTSADNQRTLWSYHADIHTRVTALARALGYEWKRTGAKEGWERTYAHVTWPNIPLGPQYQRAILVSDRRKADRRKPVEPPKAAARTGAKRGPQRRATH